MVRRVRVRVGYYNVYARNDNKACLEGLGYFMIFALFRRMLAVLCKFYVDELHEPRSKNVVLTETRFGNKITNYE